jgi:hypothetical protein
VPVALPVPLDHVSVEHVQGREQRGVSMALVVVGGSSCPRGP